MVARSSVAEAVDLGLEELDRAIRLLRSLDGGDWAKPTDCTGWSVHDVVAHMVGQFEGAARPDRLLRRVRAARRMPGVSVLDGHNQLQVRQRAGLRPAELAEQMQAWGRRGITRLGRIPRPIRGMRLSRLFPEAVEMVEDSLDYLIRVIGPRDPWMHRLDICRATGRAVEPDGHDARIVEQIVLDLMIAWAGPPVTLALDGPAGGKWVVGEGVPVAEVCGDAIEWCRRVSGRPAAQPEVNGNRAVGETLVGARVIF
ncbi:MAG TPA: maleylpyruvate isomerase family mycothiol-dependent enzyme [Candidatus Limnocylindrales bacterium]